MTGRDTGTEEKLRLMRGRVHSVEITNQESAVITGVNDVESFNEQEIVMLTELGALMLAGEGLHIVRLDLDEGVLAAEGRILAMEYVEARAQKGRKGGVLSGLFR